MDSSASTLQIIVAVSEIAIAIGTIALAVIAVWAIRTEGKRVRLALGADLVFRLDERFNSQDMKEMRQSVARNINQSPNLQSPNLQPVLDFFEPIGQLMRNGVLDKELVYCMFFRWIHHYRHLAKDYIANERHNRPQIWEDFLYLHEQLLPLEQERSRPGASLQPTQQDLSDFIEEELNLLPLPS